MADAHEQAEEPGLRDYLRILLRRLPIILAVILVVEGAVVTYAVIATKLYEASATLLLQPKTSESLFDPATGVVTDPARQVQTEIQVVKSIPVKEAVKKQLGVAPSIGAGQVGQTDVIQVSATSSVPKDAATIANAYAHAYIDFKRKQAVDDLLAAGQEIQSKIDQLTAQVNAPGQSQANKDAAVSQIALFKGRLEQLQVDAALKTGGAQLVSPAQVPAKPIRPQPIKDGILGGVAALILGIGAALLREQLDDTIKSKDDLDRAHANLPVIGLIPAVPDQDGRRNDVIALSDPAAPVSEAYRSLRTAIQFMGVDREMRVVQITSPRVGEGKTTTICNVGAVLAKAGQRVLIIDCDLRRPRVHEYFGVDNTVGFTSVLIGDAQLQDAVVHVVDDLPLYVLPSGALPPNPSELLWTQRTTQLFGLMRNEFDICLVDSPPVLPVTDPVLIAKSADAVVLVASAGITTRKQLHRAVELLRQVAAPLEGIVLNRSGDHTGYGYSYSYRYASPEETSSNGRSAKKSRQEKRRERRAS